VYVDDPANGSDLNGLFGGDSVGSAFEAIGKAAQKATNWAKNTAKNAAKAVGRRVWTNGLGKHWRGALQVVTVVASVACIAATAGTAAACLYGGMALSAASTAQSAYDNLYKRKRACWGNFAKDAVLNIASAALPLERVTTGAARLAGVTRPQNGFNAGATSSATALGNVDYCS
jgi:hypothetical protein